MFFDFHIHRDEELVLEAQRLGYAGIALIRHGNNSQNSHHFLDNQIKEDKSKENSIKVYEGVEISAKNQDDLKRKVQKLRKKAPVLLVHGGDLKINRAACENLQVDILSHPYRSRRDSGINHVIARKAAENRVAIELNLKYLLKFRPSHRHRILSYFKDILKLQRKFKFPLIISSGAHSIYDLHTPRDIMALSSCFGMNKEEIVGALSQTPQDIIERSLMRDISLVAGARIKV